VARRALRPITIPGFPGSLAYTFRRPRGRASKQTIPSAYLLRGIMGLPTGEPGAPGGYDPSQGTFMSTDPYRNALIATLLQGAKSG